MGSCIIVARCSQSWAVRPIGAPKKVAEILGHCCLETHHSRIGCSDKGARAPRANKQKETDTLLGAHLQLPAREPAGIGGRAARPRSRRTRWSELAHLHALIEVVENVHVVLVQLKVEEVGIGFDTRLGQRFGQDDVPDVHPPLEQDLCGGLVMLLGDGDDLGPLERGTLGHGRVCLNVDPAFDGRLPQILVLEEGVGLDLVHSGLDASVGEEVVQLLNIEVGDPNRLDLTRVYGVFHRLPCLEPVVAVSPRGMEQVQVHVGKPQLGQGLIDGFCCALMVSVPKLGGDKDVRPGRAGLGNEFVDGTADGLLVCISCSW